MCHVPQPDINHSSIVRSLTPEGLQTGALTPSKSQVLADAAPIVPDLTGAKVREPRSSHL